MLFAEIIGQDNLKLKLRNSVLHGRVAHAQLLVGPSGSGALPLALAYAQYLACTARGELDSCGQCSSCIRYAKLEHPDLQLIFPKNRTQKVDHDHFSSRDFLLEWRRAVLKQPYLNLNDWLKELGIDNKQGTINVDDSREIIQNLSYKAYEADHRVVLIWLAEHMNIPAANKLLKILEEPPARTVFLLVAESTENMLQTILSRVQLHKMGRLKAAEISAALSSETDDHAQLASLAELADGDLNLARQLLNDKASVTYSIDFFIRWMRACFVLNMEQLVDLLEEFNALGREQQKDLLSRSTGILRKGLMYSSGGGTSTGLLREEMDFMHKFSRFINPENSEGMLAEINQAHYHIERNANPRIVFTDLSFKLSDLLKVGALN